MSCPEIAKHFIGWPASGQPLADEFQAAVHFNGPCLLNILFYGFQTLQKGLRQVRALGRR